MNSLSEDTNVHVRGGDPSYKLPKLNTSTIQIATEFFSLLFLPPSFSLGSLPLFILYLFLHLYPTRGQLMVYADTCLISLLYKSLGIIVKLKKYLQGPQTQGFIIYPYIRPVAQAEDKNLPEEEKSSSEKTMLINRKVGFCHNSSGECAVDENVLGQMKSRS